MYELPLVSGTPTRLSWKKTLVTPAGTKNDLRHGVWWQNKCAIEQAATVAASWLCFQEIVRPKKP
jgi:hypothetical protein